MYAWESSNTWVFLFDDDAFVNHFAVKLLIERERLKGDDAKPMLHGSIAKASQKTNDPKFLGGAGALATPLLVDKMYDIWGSQLPHLSPLTYSLFFSEFLKQINNNSTIVDSEYLEWSEKYYAKENMTEITGEWSINR